MKEVCSHLVNEVIIHYRDGRPPEQAGGCRLTGKDCVRHLRDPFSGATIDFGCELANKGQGVLIENKIST